MPLRDLMYVVELYSEMTRNANLYGSKRILIPTPRFVIFYNGEEHMPDVMELKLSDSFTVQEPEVFLELKTTMLNINLGHNRELMESCRTLHDYAVYTAAVRDYARDMPIEEAVEKAIKDCISNNILAEYLDKNRAEVIRVSIYEYDEEKHMRQEREASREEGMKKGIEIGIERGEDRMICLVQRLAVDGEMDTIAHLSELGKNKNKLEELYEKYNIE